VEEMGGAQVEEMGEVSWVGVEEQRGFESSKRKGDESDAARG